MVSSPLAYALCDVCTGYICHLRHSRIHHMIAFVRFGLLHACPVLLSVWTIFYSHSVHIGNQLQWCAWTYVFTCWEANGKTSLQWVQGNWSVSVCMYICHSKVEGMLNVWPHSSQNSLSCEALKCVLRSFLLDSTTSQSGHLNFHTWGCHCCHAMCGNNKFCFGCGCCFSLCVIC